MIDQWTTRHGETVQLYPDAKDPMGGALLFQVRSDGLHEMGMATSCFHLAERLQKLSEVLTHVRQMLRWHLKVEAADKAIRAMGLAPTVQNSDAFERYGRRLDDLKDVRERAHARLSEATGRLLKAAAKVLAPTGD
jgi:hypothetical protein